MFIRIASVLLLLVHNIPMAHDLRLMQLSNGRHWGRKTSIVAIGYLYYPIIQDGLYNMQTPPICPLPKAM